ncbi:hypothetical protein [Conexibacter sp. SYSU D00693]|uniref:hypothetical protein n=1 Tax=Conexibacter sp. SYSU D00693 TaxID=2812560 RepID=UPI00196AA7A0|nr:hypothetical protein [Conexibacter sp. SYSU D00693]
MTRSSASRRAFGAAVLAGLLGPAGAHAAGGGFWITPARIDARVERGTLLAPVVVGNDTGRTLAVTATVLLADQGLDGLPTWTLTPAAVREGRTVARVSPATFRLAPRQQRKVRLRVVGRAPRRGRGTYGVLLLSAVGARPATASRSFVSSRIRLSANLLLRYGGGGAAAGGAEALRAAQGPGRSLVFAAQVRNTGDLHGRPRARLRVRDRDGRLVARATFPTGNVLPGARRELTTAVRRVLPAGTYTARVVVDLGARRTTRDLRLRLVAPGTLPTPDLRIDALPVPEVAPGAAVTAEVVLRNAGTAPAAVTGEAALGRPGSERPDARVPVTGAPLAPGGRLTVRLALPPVAEGDRRLTVTLRDGDRTVATRSVTFQARARASAWTRFLDWAAAHVAQVLAGLGLLLVVGTLLAVVLVRRALRRARAAAAAHPERVLEHV